MRDYTPAETDDEVSHLDPWRIVVGATATAIHDGATTAPFEAWDGPLGGLLDELGSRDLLQVMVEGGANLAGSFHRAGLVDEYWIYLAPAIMGGANATSTFAGEGAATMADVQRGEFVSATKLGDDLRLIYRPRS